VTALLKLVYQHYYGAFVLGKAVGTIAGTGGMVRSVMFVVLSLVSSVLYFAVYGVTQAATTSAVSSIYLGDATSMKTALNAVKGRWARFFGISLWQLWSAFWISGLMVAPAFAIYGLGIQSKMWIAGLLFFAAFLCMIYGVIAYIRNSFAVPAAVMEDVKVRKAMRRSKVLTAGSKGRVFLLFLFMMVLYFVVLAIQSPLLVLIVKMKGPSQMLLSQGFGLFIGFVASAVIGPVGAVGLCLFYIDQRIRKEGFDIEFLMERSEEGVSVGEVAVVAVAEPESL
jgi:MFS family permease